MFLLYNVCLRTIYYFFNRFYFSVAAMFRFLSSFNLNVEVIAAKCKTTKTHISLARGKFVSLSALNFILRYVRMIFWWIRITSLLENKLKILVFIIDLVALIFGYEKCSFYRNHFFHELWWYLESWLFIKQVIVKYT